MHLVTTEGEKACGETFDEPTVSSVPNSEVAADSTINNKIHEVVGDSSSAIYLKNGCNSQSLMINGSPRCSEVSIHDIYVESGTNGVTENQRLPLNGSARRSEDHDFAGISNDIQMKSAVTSPSYLESEEAIIGDAKSSQSNLCGPEQVQSLTVDCSTELIGEESVSCVEGDPKASYQVSTESRTIILQKAEQPTSRLVENDSSVLTVDEFVDCNEIDPKTPSILAAESQPISFGEKGRTVNDKSGLTAPVETVESSEGPIERNIPLENEKFTSSDSQAAEVQCCSSSVDDDPIEIIKDTVPSSTSRPQGIVAAAADDCTTSATVPLSNALLNFVNVEALLERFLLHMHNSSRRMNELQEGLPELLGRYINSLDPTALRNLSAMVKCGEFDLPYQTFIPPSQVVHIMGVRKANKPLSATLGDAGGPLEDDSEKAVRAVNSAQKFRWFPCAAFTESLHDIGLNLALEESCRWALNKWTTELKQAEKAEKKIAYKGGEGHTDESIQITTSATKGKDDLSQTITRQRLRVEDMKKSLSDVMRFNETVKPKGLQHCWRCDFVADTTTALEEHLLQPHKESHGRWQCSFCDFWSGDRDELEEHCVDTHNRPCRFPEDEPRFKCPMCFEGNFQYKAQQTNHIRTCKQRTQLKRTQAPTEDDLLHINRLFWNLSPAQLTQVQLKMQQKGMSAQQQVTRHMVPSGASRPLVRGGVPPRLTRQPAPAAAASFPVPRSFGSGPQFPGRTRAPSVPKGSLLPKGNSVQPLAVARGISMDNPLLRAPMSPRNPVLPGLSRASTKQFTPIAPRPALPIPNLTPGSASAAIRSSILHKASSTATHGRPSLPTSTATSIPKALPSGPTLRPILPAMSLQAYCLPAGTGTATVSCELCDGELKDVSHYLLHLQMVHKRLLSGALKDISRTAKLSCSKCGSRFHTYEGLERHLLMEHGLVSQDLWAKVQSKQDGGRCKICGKVFAFNMVQHVGQAHQRKLCSAEIMYNCDMCQASFSSHVVLEAHLKEKHSSSTACLPAPKAPVVPSEVAVSSSMEMSASEQLTRPAQGTLKRKWLKLPESIAPASDSGNVLSSPAVGSRASSGVVEAPTGSKVPKLAHLGAPPLGMAELKSQTQMSQSKTSGSTPTASSPATSAKPKVRYSCTPCGIRFTEYNHVLDHWEQRHLKRAYVALCPVDSCPKHRMEVKRQYGLNDEAFEVICRSSNTPILLKQEQQQSNGTPPEVDVICLD